MLGSSIWGKLIRIAGNDESLTIPSLIQMTDNIHFFGRIPQPISQGHEANNGNATSFSHETQFAIPCVYISSTHFSIKKINNDANDNNKTQYLLTDYSKNGTFVNNLLVGKDKTMEIEDGFSISIHYKNVVKILYRFNTIDHNNNNASHNKDKSTSQSTKLFINGLKAPDDVIVESLNQHIQSLTEENKNNEIRIQNQLQNIENITKELELMTRKYNHFIENDFEEMKTIANERKDTIIALEGNLNAIQARFHKINEQLDENKDEVKELKLKNQGLMDDNKHNTIKLNNRESLLEEANKSLGNEQNKRIKLEKENQKLLYDLQESEKLTERMAIANQALQDLVAQRDQTIVDLKHNYNKNNDNNINGTVDGSCKSFASPPLSNHSHNNDNNGPGQAQGPEKIISDYDCTQVPLPILDTNMIVTLNETNLQKNNYYSQLNNKNYDNKIISENNHIIIKTNDKEENKSILSQNTNNSTSKRRTSQQNNDDNNINLSQHSKKRKHTGISSPIPERAMTRSQLSQQSKVSNYSNNSNINKNNNKRMKSNKKSLIMDEHEENDEDENYESPIERVVHDSNNNNNPNKLLRVQTASANNDNILADETINPILNNTTAMEANADYWNNNDNISNNNNNNNSNNNNISSNSIIMDESIYERNGDISPTMVHNHMNEEEGQRQASLDFDNSYVSDYHN
eukprot:gene5324-7390_t